MARGARGHQARKPSEIPPKGWLDIGKRVLQQSKVDHISLISAGIAFYAFLAVFPALIAAVSVYGLFTDPSELEGQLAAVSGVMPQQVYDLLGEQLRSLTQRPKEALGWSLLIGILLSLWSANRGTRAMFKGLNIAYDEKNSRGFLRENAMTLLFTVGIVFGAIVALSGIVGISVLVEHLAIPSTMATLLSLARWPVLCGGLLIALASLYKAAPVRTNPTVRWVSVGSAIAIALWIAGSLGFSLYVENFGSYGDTYGSLAGIAIFLLWLYLSAYIVLLGAEINAEMEHQTARDTTIGPDKPMGERGAYHADHVAP